MKTTRTITAGLIGIILVALIPATTTAADAFTMPTADQAPASSTVIIENSAPTFLPSVAHTVEAAPSWNEGDFDVWS